MKWQRFGTWTITGAMLLGLAIEAQAGVGVRRAHRAERAKAGTEAVAALSAVGGAAGWGRVEVQDSSRDGLPKREVKAELFNLEPYADYTIEIDGVSLGAVRTDGLGWATLKLESPDDRHPPVPAGLPAASDLRSASVFDVSSAYVLEGEFGNLVTSGGDSSLHEERIPLTDPSGVAAGVAKVERGSSGKQEFDTRATGLMAGEAYTIMVDGLMAGMVVADEVGQARLSLETPDTENPLPPELQPVEDLRLVEWFDASDMMILTGSFTGVSNDDDGDDDQDDGAGDDDVGDDDVGDESFHGQVTALSADGFTLESGMLTLTVVVTADTMYEDLSGLSDLMVGDMVEAEGQLVDTTLTASRVELMNAPDDENEDESGDEGGQESLDGTVTTVGMDSLELMTSSGPVSVIVTPDTKLKHLSSLGELQPGDVVEVDGQWSDGSFMADRIELKR